MCTFLTVAIAPSRRIGLINALREAWLEVVDQPNPSIAARFPGEALLLVTHGGCSCDLGPPTKGAEPAARLARRGLSKGQVKRALEALANAPEKASSSLWTERLRPILEAHAPLGFVFHQVKKSPLTEALPSSVGVQLLTVPRKTR